MKITKEEKEKVISFYDNLIANLAAFPISFTYNKQLYTGINKEFKTEVKKSPTNGDKETAVITALHETGLQIKIITALYRDYGAAEWTVYFKNTAAYDSGLLENITAADITLEGTNPVLHGILGDGCEGCYSPYDIPIKPYMSIELEVPDGKPCECNFPYFNLEIGDGGALIAIGWPGQWKSRLENNGESSRFIAGQGEFSSILKPGETARTPLISFLFYIGRNESRAANLWRKWFIDCNMRKIDGKLFEPVVSGGTSCLYEEMAKATDKNQIEAIKAYVSHGVKLDYWWMDAGWYYKTGEQSLDVWLDTGNWVVDKKRFPSEFADISDYGAKYGIKTLLWFEPEVVRLDPNLLTSEGIKPEWILNKALLNSGTPAWLVADFGNSDFREWLLERVSRIIKKGKISLYRQDYGIFPLASWKADEAENRRGMTENLYVQGYLSFWDELIKRFPNMMLDSCASGGRRNDLESMRRAVPLHKTDANYSDFTLKQCIHYSLYKWLPYFGTPVFGGGYPDPNDQYAMRSAFVPWIAMGFDIREDNIDYEFIKKSIAEWKRFNHLFYADYYPLTPWSKFENEWIGWEFINSDSGNGVIQLYRRERNEEAVKTIKLFGLEEDKTYSLENIGGEIDYASGKELMQSGYKIEIPNPRSGIVVLIKGIK